MRLLIKTERFRLHIILPTCLVLNKLTLTIALWAARSYVTLPTERRTKFFRQLRTLRKQCRGLPVAEIRTASGEEILLRL